ncbi:acylphosphatase [Streptomyces tubercidicus]|uniref:acylphosphatase n=1 Tax=Streptomyces tubercidicus TaxID=47759 RepID=UPI0030E4DDE0|nr:acylphosphatase [Streptomyces tubercidicus]
MIRRRMVVSGDVHGVFFRDTCRRTADELGVSGWVRNLADGTVEAVCEGEPESVQELVDWAHEGPPLATVDAVSVREEEPEGLTGFAIRPTAGGV